MSAWLGDESNGEPTFRRVGLLAQRGPTELGFSANRICAQFSVAYPTRGTAVADSISRFMSATASLSPVNTDLAIML